MLPQEILILRYSKIARNMYFSTYFCIVKVFKEGNQVERKWHFARDFEKKGACAPCAPRFRQTLRKLSSVAN